MPPDNRQVDVQLEHGDRNPPPTGGVIRQELVTAIGAHIDQLVKEEERLYRQGRLVDKDRARLAQLKVELDQCWDLLRQRRALREFGEDPDKAKGSSRKDCRELRTVDRSPKDSEST